MKPSMVPLIAAVTVASAFAGVQALTPSQVAKRQQTISNAKQATVAVTLYSGDYDDVFPSGASTGLVKRQVAPYLRDLKLWRSENPGSDLLFNVKLSGASFNALPSVADIPMVFESKAWADGARVIGYVDNHVKAEPSNSWPAIEKMLKKSWPKANSRKKGL